MSKKFYDFKFDTSKKYNIVLGKRGGGRSYFFNQIKNSLKGEQNERKQKHS